MSRQISCTLVAGARIRIDQAAGLLPNPHLDSEVASEAAMALVEWYGASRPHGLDAFPVGSSDGPQAIVVGLAVGRIDIESGEQERTWSTDDMLATFRRAAEALARVDPELVCAWHLVSFET